MVKRFLGRHRPNFVGHTCMNAMIRENMQYYFDLLKDYDT